MALLSVVKRQSLSQGRVEPPPVGARLETGCRTFIPDERGAEGAGLLLTRCLCGWEQMGRRRVEAHPLQLILSGGHRAWSCRTLLTQPPASRCPTTLGAHHACCPTPGSYADQRIVFTRKLSRWSNLKLVFLPQLSHDLICRLEEVLSLDSISLSSL